jgi:hypothetical protein
MTDEELYRHVWQQVWWQSHPPLAVYEHHQISIPTDLRVKVDVGVEAKIVENINPILGTLVAHYWSIETNEDENNL